MEHFEIMLHLNRDSQSDLKDAYHFMNNQEFIKAKKAFQSAYNLFPFHQTRVPNRFLGGNEKKYEKVLSRLLETSPNFGYAIFEKYVKAYCENKFQDLLPFDLSKLKENSDESLKIQKEILSAFVKFTKQERENVLEFLNKITPE